jgi:hypothetical protein
MGGTFMMQTVQTKKNVERLKPTFISRERYFVPDLSPRDRETLSRMKPDFVFVAESPHVSEVAPEKLFERRPLCGVAGKQWWSLLSEILEGSKNEDVSLVRLLQICSRYQIAVLNAVQSPLDPKVAAQFPEANPNQNLEFNKVTGPLSYKKLKTSKAVQAALKSLNERLNHPQLADARIYCLGNDAEWFVKNALSQSPALSRVDGRIPHPSAWWRRGGLFGRTAREKLSQIFS